MAPPPWVAPSIIPLHRRPEPNVHGLAGNDSITLHFDADGVVSCGGAGRDSVVGQEDMNRMYGEKGADYLEAGDGLPPITTLDLAPQRLPQTVAVLPRSS